MGRTRISTIQRTSSSVRKEVEPLTTGLLVMQQGIQFKKRSST